MKDKEILNVVMEIGYLLLKHGAEVYRAEQSVIYICEHYAVQRVDAFAIPSSLVVSIGSADDFITRTRRVHAPQTNLDKVEKLNALSRDICEQNLSFEEITRRIEQIKHSEGYPPIIKKLAMAAMATSFTVLFGGNAYEGVASFAVGIIVAFIMAFLERQNANNFIKTAVCSLTISAMAVFAGAVVPQLLTVQPIMSGSLMLLVPGLALTNCMRDFMANDYLAGTIKLAEALMTALASALGVAVVLLGAY